MNIGVIVLQFAGSYRTLHPNISRSAHSREKSYSFPNSLLSTISIAMSTYHWSVFFDETLLEYVQQYIKACGDPVARAVILRDCEVCITDSPMHEEEDIELPINLGLVSISFH